MNAKILVAAHKPYWMPSDPLYLPVQVGAAGKESIPGLQRDDEGANISEKNPCYSELTALYWGWKNLDVDYMGLVHYRRHFAGSGERDILSSDDLSSLQTRAAVVLPKQRNYRIESIESHYSHTFDRTQLELLREAVVELSPEYSNVLDRHLAQRMTHVCNMMIAPSSILDEYCSWLFPLLAYVDERIDYSALNSFEARAVGRLSERMLDPWLTRNGVKYVDVPFALLERTNWLKKSGRFLAAKFFGRRYRSE